MILGQQLYYVPARFYQRHMTPVPGSDVTVTKIGRKWVDLSNGYRIDKITMLADGKGYQSPGRAWLSQQIYEDRLAVCNEWNKFHKSLRDSYNAPDDMTLDRIEAARIALGMK